MASPNTLAQFVTTYNLSSATMTTSNIARDGSGSLTPIFTATTNGSRVDYIVFTSSSSGQTTANTAKVCRVFVSNTSGSNPKLRAEVALPAVTPSSTAIGATATITFTNGMLLASGQIISVTQSAYVDNRDNTDTFVHGGNY